MGREVTRVRGNRGQKRKKCGYLMFSLSMRQSKLNRLLLTTLVVQEEQLVGCVCVCASVNF